MRGHTDTPSPRAKVAQTKTSDSPRTSLFPLHNLLPCLLVQEIVDKHHHLDTLLWRVPALPRERVVELLRRRVVPNIARVLSHGVFRAGNSRRRPVDREVHTLSRLFLDGRQVVRDRVERVEVGRRIARYGAFRGCSSRA